MEFIEIAGHKFALKDYTRKNANEFKVKGKEIEEAFENEEYDRFEYYYRLLQVIADGPIDKISPDDIEGRKMEEFIMSFIPPSLRSIATLIGYSAL